MEALILRVASRHGPGESHHRMSGDELSIGRGLFNQVIVSDPYVGAEQLRLRRSAEGVELEVLDRTNPVLVNRRPVAESSLRLRPGDSIAVGHSVFTLLSERDPIAPTRVLSLSLWSRIGAAQPIVAFAALLLMSGVALYEAFLETAEKPDWGELASAPLALSMFVLTWAAIWAIVGRVLRHQAFFSTHLLAAAAATILSTQLSVAASYLSYASGFTRSIDAMDWLLGTVFTFMLLWCNLRWATGLRRPWLAAGLSVLLLMTVMYGIDYLGEDDFNPAPVAQTLLKPPFAKLRDGLELDEYQKSVDQLFVEVRKAKASTD